LKPTILHCIGNSSLVPLRKIAPANGSRILLKIESENPTGSMKDRMALAMIEAAEADGRLPPQGAVVEYTGGSTGVSLALVCAVKGHKLNIVQEVSDTHTLIGLVAAGVGVSLVPASLQNLQIAQVRYIPLREKTPMTTLQLVYSKENLSTVLGNFVRMVERMAPDMGTALGAGK